MTKKLGIGSSTVHYLFYSSYLIAITIIAVVASIICYSVGLSLGRFVNNNNIISTQYKDNVIHDKDKRVYLIHIGKAGGETIMINAFGIGQLGRNGDIKCRMNKTINGEDDDICYDQWLSNHPKAKDSQLSRHVIGFFHMHGFAQKKKERYWLQRNTNTFLFTARDPIDRLISAYNYHRRLKMNITKYPVYKTFYSECFPKTFNDMVTDIITVQNYTACKQLGLSVLRGDHVEGIWLDGGGHFQYNYKYYLNYSNSEWGINHSVAVIRTEHMWNDIITLDLMFGGLGKFDAEGSKFSHKSEKFMNNTDISQSNVNFLCCFLHNEMEAYQIMILKAFNIKEAEKHETLSKLYHRCQIKIPRNIPRKPFQWSEIQHSKSCTTLRR